MANQASVQAADTRMDHPCAQSNVELYEQWIAAGAKESELVRLHVAYDLARDLFTGQFRPSGKTFLAHLIGTASILVWMRASSDEIVAGLLHAAYAFGDFGDGTARGVTPARRELVRGVVGSEVEALVFAYTRLGWNRERIGGFISRKDELEPQERQVLRMRLANELEDHTHRGVFYDADPTFRVEYLKENGEAMITLARALNEPCLADAMKRCFAECLENPVPEVLRSDKSHSFKLTPRSYRHPLRRYRMALRGLLRSLRRGGP